VETQSRAWADPPFLSDLKNKNKEMSFGDLAHYLYLTANIARVKHNLHNLVDRRYEIEKKERYRQTFFSIRARRLIINN